jgi:hypothetical protein
MNNSHALRIGPVQSFGGIMGMDIGLAGLGQEE